MNKEKKKVIIYCRIGKVVKEEIEEMYSGEEKIKREIKKELKKQKNELIKECMKKGYDIHALYTDTTDDRRQYGKMLSEIERNEIDTIVIYSIDSLINSVLELRNICLNIRDIHILDIDYCLKYDSYTPINSLIYSFAELEEIRNYENRRKNSSNIYKS